MILLDSDHVSILLDPRQKLRERLMSRIDAASNSVCLPIIVVEEHMRGWLAAIHRVRVVHKQVVPYLHLANLIDFLTAWTITGWNETAADRPAGKLIDPNNYKSKIQRRNWRCE